MWGKKKNRMSKPNRSVDLHPSGLRKLSLLRLKQINSGYLRRVLCEVRNSGGSVDSSCLTPGHLREHRLGQSFILKKIAFRFLVGKRVKEWKGGPLHFHQLVSP